MGKPVDVLHYVIGGHNVGGEIWRTGLWCDAHLMISSQADLQAAVDAQLPGVETWWDAIRVYCYPLCTFDQLSAYYYATGGSAATYQAEATAAGSPGTLAGNGSPIDTCMVQSLRTARPGRSYRGRMYVPCHQPVTAASGLYSNVLAGIFADATQALCDDINTSFAEVDIVSAAAVDKTPVTTILVDTKPDVQRRRENRLVAGAPAVRAVTAHA